MLKCVKLKPFHFEDEDFGLMKPEKLSVSLDLSLRGSTGVVVAGGRLNCNLRVWGEAELGLVAIKRGSLICLIKTPALPVGF